MTPEDEKLPMIYAQRRWGVTASAVRQLGTKLKQQLSIGHALDSTRPRSSGRSPASTAQREPFARDRAAALGGRLGAVRRLLVLHAAVPHPPQRADLRPRRGSPARAGLRGVLRRRASSCSARTRTSSAAAIGAGLDACRGAAMARSRLAAGYSTRHQDGELRDNVASIVDRAIVTPTYGYAAARRREHVRDAVERPRDRGSTRSARTTGCAGSASTSSSASGSAARRSRSRSIPTALWVLRVGGVVFYDVGGAADRLGDARGCTTTSGVGVRMLLPQTSRELFRFDLAFPLDGVDAGEPEVHRGLSVRVLSAGRVARRNRANEVDRGRGQPRRQAPPQPGRAHAHAEREGERDRRARRRSGRTGCRRASRAYRRARAARPRRSPARRRRAGTARRSQQRHRRRDHGGVGR